MGSGISDICLLNVGGEGLQDLEDLIAVAASAEQGECQVAGHQNSGRKVGGVFRGAAIPIGSAFQLCQGGGSDVRGGTAGAIEFYHTVCLLFTGEPLRAPLGVVVGGLVTDFEAHRVSCVVREFYRVGRGGS